MTEIAGARPTALVVDDILALDAGSLCSGLTLDEQRRLKAVLITHYHYDHVKDLPILGMNVAYHSCLDVFATAATLDALTTHLLDGKLYPDFRRWPESQPAMNLVRLEEGQRTAIAGYGVTALPVPHGVPSVGFHIVSPEGKSLFFTGDTAGGLSGCWDHMSPDLFITELTWPQDLEDWARKTTHLAPGLLKTELAEFRRLKGYLPRTVLVHLNVDHESKVAGQVAEIARELGANIALGQEGMTISV